MSNWMIYGAYGYTGQLVAQEALRRGHRPLLAGRSEEKLSTVAEGLGLDWVAVSLDDASALRQAVSRVDLVFHAAGPFIRTSDPMIRACLDAGAHYLDITGEVPVFQNTFSHDQAAIKGGVALISGVGFDVIPTDCMAAFVTRQLPNAVELELAIAALGNTSPGTTKTMLEMLPRGNRVLRDSRLGPHPWGKGAKRVRFPDKARTVVPIPWGDLATALQTTGVPNVTTYMAFPKRTIRWMRWLAPLGQRVLALQPLRRLLGKWIERTVQGPDEETRQRGRAYVWARAADRKGREVQAWLETIESYRFTAVGGVHCVEKVLEQRPQGALTPALAFGADLLLEIEGTRRFDRLGD